MKIKFTFLAFILISMQAYSQVKNDIDVVYGTTSNQFDIHGVIGDFGYTGHGGNTYGINYTRIFNQYVSVQTGLFFSDDKVQLNSILASFAGVHIPQDEIKMYTVPVILKFTFFKYLFIDMGLLADFETNTPNNSTTSKQSGIGFEFGGGAQYTWKHLHLFANPYAQQHATITTFNAYKQPFNLLDSGFKFGVGYGF